MAYQEIKKIRLTPLNADLLYRALLAHDGPSLRPDWPTPETSRLTDVLDDLRRQLAEGH